MPRHRTVGLVVVAVMTAVGGACKQERPPPKLERVTPPRPILPTEPAPAPPDAVAVTMGAVPGEDLVRFAPATLSGVARTQLLDQAFAVAAAYALAGGEYINLDIKNTFRRGGMTGEDDQAATCPKVEEIGGYAACVRRSAGRFSAHWDLKDRLTVDLSGPDEGQVKVMAKELPLRALATLSAE